MKKSFIFGMAFVVFASLFTSVQSAKSAEQIKLLTPTDTLSYSLGMQFGNDLKNNNVKIDTKVFAQALSDVLNGVVPLLTEDDVKNAITNLNNQLREKEMERQKQLADMNTKASKEFLEKNAKEAGVMQTASGLQYKINVPGTGIQPTEKDTVEVHYTGKLIDGTVFDSSVERGQTVSFPLGNVIKGWTEGLQLMKEGAKYTFYIPSELGYGERGAGGVIGPNQALIFDVELIKVKKAK